VVFANRYDIKSNRESGYGRLDIMLVPKNKSLPGIIIEFKKKTNNETLSQAAERAMEQIRDRKYATDVYAAGVSRVVGFGVALYKKEVLVIQQEL